MKTPKLANFDQTDLKGFRAGSTKGPIGPGPRAPRLGGPRTYKNPPKKKKKEKKGQWKKKGGGKKKKMEWKFDRC